MNNVSHATVLIVLTAYWNLNTVLYYSKPTLQKISKNTLG